MIHIHIAYRTEKDQHLCLIPCQSDDSRHPVSLYDMHSEDGEQWRGTLPTDIMKGMEHLSFYFAVADINGNIMREEWHTVPHLLPASCLSCDGKKPTVVCCHWQDAPEDAYLYTPLLHVVEIFRGARSEKGGARKVKSIEQENTKAHSTILSPLSNQVCLIVRAPHRNDDEQLCLSGTDSTLGAWDTEKALAMQQVDECRWAAMVDAHVLCGTEAKFIARSSRGVRWEEGENRWLSMKEPEELMVSTNIRKALAEDKVSLFELSDARLPAVRPRFAGTLVPVFSLRSEGSFGVGDFGDLYSMIDLVAQTHQHVLQLLPVNDTTTDGTWHDSYPYSAVSVFALHPMYIDLRQLPKLTLTKKQQQYFSRQQKALNSLVQVDYEQVNAVKHEYLHIAFVQQWDKVCRTKAFRQWFREAEEWLVPYAVWCMHRDTFGTAQFDQWPQQGAWQERQRRQWRTIHHTSPADHYYYYYLQWLLHTQLTAVHEHARASGVLLKGDIGIGVSPHACDVWQHPELFHRDRQAGAPPDYFSRTGQNWGFPTYNWAAMAADNYHWWQQRLRHMAHYFDAFRIDHIFGFFRIWSIPASSGDGRLGSFQPSLPLYAPLEGLPVELFVADSECPQAWHPRIDGHQLTAYHALDEHQKNTFNRLYDDYFHHRHNQLWYQEAMKKLPALLNATRMLPCGEDLGMVPESVPLVMQQLKILSLELETMPKGAHHGEFAYAAHFPYLSVCMPSTHDVSPLRLWWEEDRDRSQRYYNNMLHREGAAPDSLTPDIADDILRHYLHSPSMLCIIPIQDWLATISDIHHLSPEMERVNDPANSRHYWRYRMSVTLEELKAHATWTAHLYQLIAESGRDGQEDGQIE